MKEVKEKEKVKKEEDKKKKIIIALIILLLLCIFLIWWFNRKFEVAFKYNNAAFQDNKVTVKYLRKIKDEDAKEDLTVDGLTFVGWFETYLLNDKDIKKIKDNPKLEGTICKKGFRLDSNKIKCIAEKEFDFKTTKIKKATTIEALWNSILFNINPTNKTINEGESFFITYSLSGTNNKVVTFVSNNPNIASVDANGKVIGLKKGETIIVVESNGIKKKCIVTVNEIPKEEPKVEEPVKEEPKKEEPVAPKDEGTVKLSATDQCIIGSNEVRITATVNNAIDKTINWDTKLKCFNVTKESDTVYKISRIGRGTMCRDTEEPNPVIKATLNNGNTDSLTFTYEPTLTINVYDNGKEIQPTNGIYKGNNITINTSAQAMFTAVSDFSGDRIQSKTDKSITLQSYSRCPVTITTTCGQKLTINVEEEIN